MTKFYATLDYRQGNIGPNAEIKVFDSHGAMLEFLYDYAQSEMPNDETPWTATIRPGRFASGHPWKVYLFKDRTPTSAAPVPFDSWEQMEVSRIISGPKSDVVYCDEGGGDPTVHGTFFVSPKVPVYTIQGIQEVRDVRLEWAPEHEAEIGHLLAPPTGGGEA